MKKIFYSAIIMFLWASNVWADYKNDIIPIAGGSSAVQVTGEWTWIIWWIATYITDTLFWILTVVWIWVFLVLGARLVMARGNPEEFKKNFMWMVYGLIWIAIMTIAYAVVTFVTRISI